MPFLSETIDAVVSGTNGWHHSSVNGRFAVFPLTVKPALDAALSIMQSAVANGVELTIGVACGRVEFRRDVDGLNWAGTAINLAARLAAAPEKHEDLKSTPRRKIAVHSDVVKDARVATSFDFGEEFKVTVKRTELTFALMKSIGKLKRGSAPVLQVGSQPTVCTVVYDIVKYSELTLQNQVRIGEDR